MKKLLFVLCGFFILSAFNVFNEEDLNALRNTIEEAKQEQGDIEKDLCLAAREGDEETFFDLYYDSPKKAKTICIINGRNVPIIIVAAKYKDNNTAILRQLFISGKRENINIVEMHDGDGFTPLMWAVAYDNIENVKYLVEVGGADVNAKNNAGRDVLFQVNNGKNSQEILAFLKAHGAVDNSIETKANAIIQDIIKNHPDSEALEPKLKQLKAMGAKIPSKLYFVYNRGGNDQKCIYLLASYGANPNYYDYSKEPTPTPLLLYLNQEKDFYGCAALLKNGADPNKANAQGITPLMAAAGAMGISAQHTDWCIEELIKAGADINAKDNNGKTALQYTEKHSAYASSYFPAGKAMLLKYGAK